MKRGSVIALCLIMLLTSFGLSGCGADGKSTVDKDAVEISFWIPKGEDSTYYASYNDNPVVKYLETLTYNGKHIDLNFFTPVAGAEIDNFNTLMATEEYMSLMDMSYSTTSAVELYQDGVIYDLTDYVDQYMPNYKTVLEKNPDLASQVYSKIDGEKKILGIYAINEEIMSNFKGFLYRRDWVAKYGVHPETGAAFTYGYQDPENAETWYDDIVFPSGGSDPVYISDWEWMFRIFDTAMADLGINDGYCLSLCYKGSNEDGALYNAFGGGAPMWYREKDGSASFGGCSESMRTYLECMNAWWDNGWLDKAFSERTSDAVYNIDPAAVCSGKVGMWIGRRAQTGSQLDTGEGYTSGIMVYGARCPINDVYGSDAVKDREPFSIYQYSKLQHQVVLTKKIAEEDLPTVLAFVDYLYSLEGACVETFGLTKEQFTLMQDASYIKYGLTDGAYRVEQNEDGSNRYVVADALMADNYLCQAMAGKRITVGYKAEGFIPALNASYPLTMQRALGEWDYYINTGFPESSLRAQFTTDESAVYSKVHANVDTFMSTRLPKFISGELDVNNEEDWNDYCKMLNKYAPEKVTQAYQRLYDDMN